MNRNYIQDCVEILGLDDVVTASSRSGRTVKVVCCSGKFGFDIDLKSRQILYTFQRGALDCKEVKEVSALLSIAGQGIKRI
ncbi:hypothetical protein GCM10022297_01300 [Lactobacillus hamsteri]|uniref:hypothetical protein n=1 Tax=Lactobacillus hamsteri TaxID=96565 RepID=UPI000468BFA8|nr:hypothetical protein [Lactobacillus hamsteri]